MKTIADFQVEILENNELRLSKISQLDSLEEESTQLLGQANLALVGYTKKNDLDYAAYEKELSEVQNWYMLCIRNHCWMCFTRYLSCDTHCIWAKYPENIASLCYLHTQIRLLKCRDA